MNRKVRGYMNEIGKQACKIVILASGNGTNAQALIDYFAGSDLASIVLVASDKADANVLNRARLAGIDAVHLPRSLYSSGRDLNALLEEYEADLVVLAGYLKLIPEETVRRFAGRMVNLHPALLPRHGGKGMYGMRVHRAVLEAGDAFSGITVHLVNEEYDKGEMLKQERLEVQKNWSPEDLAQAIHKIEHRVLPEVVAQLCADIRAGRR